MISDRKMSVMLKEKAGKQVVEVWLEDIRNKETSDFVYQGGT